MQKFLTLLAGLGGAGLGVIGMLFLVAATMPKYNDYLREERMIAAQTCFVVAVILIVIAVWSSKSNGSQHK